MQQTFSVEQTFFTGREAFEWLMQESDQLIIVKFVAPYCPSCETLKSVLHQIAIENTGKLHLVELDMSEELELTIMFAVRSAPTVVLLKKQKILAQITGLKPKKQYADTIQSAL
ncbi:thioredoxin family protein [aff. Roholtiella sp. LEGE 12411]|uniref:thioredoxin family protein n=1 Tax=aff. Roholtiella sp. LEGE 12411 TaxID=1828822 RepID=UPI00187F4376|nr:thioredoxin domain-containing protein [aff. Roholtiella sp. LEGE 12411]MBE9038830.1 thioredoxin fold domain-containing protein [aff. Roholtiella sp. LEGE 12411]